jgi:hypothetical protein
MNDTVGLVTPSRTGPGRRGSAAGTSGQLPTRSESESRVNLSSSQVPSQVNHCQDSGSPRHWQLENEPQPGRAGPGGLASYFETASGLPPGPGPPAESRPGNGSRLRVGGGAASLPRTRRHWHCTSSMPVSETRAPSWLFRPAACRYRSDSESARAGSKKSLQIIFPME